MNWKQPNYTEINRCKAFFVLVFFPSLIFATGFSISDPDHSQILLTIPSSKILQEGQYHVSGRFQYFNFSDSEKSQSTPFDSGLVTELRSLNYTSELSIGIGNRAEIAAQYGSLFSLSLKALVLREDVLWPEMVLGVRNILGSQEADVYGVSDPKIQKEVENEYFITGGKSLNKKSRFSLGLSGLPNAEKGWVSISGALEYELGMGGSVAYEVFERFSDFHQNLILQWKFKDLIALSLGMTDFQSWIRQGGEWGFYYKPSKSLVNGYNAPGITVALHVLSWLPKRVKKTVPERLALLELKNQELEKALEELKAEKNNSNDNGPVDEHKPAETHTPIDLDAWTGESNKNKTKIEPQKPISNPEEASEKVRKNLQAISGIMNSDLADPGEIKSLMIEIIGIGPLGVAALKSMASDSAERRLRIPAILAMTFSKDPSYLPTLKNLTQNSDSQIRREALSGLVKIGNQQALDDVNRLLADKDEGVAMEAAAAYRQLTGKEPPVVAKGKSKKKKEAANKEAVKKESH